MKLTCPGCQKEFPRQLQRGRNRKFCSERCRLDYHARRRREARKSSRIRPRQRPWEEPSPPRDPAPAPADTTTPDGLREWVVSSFEMSPVELAALGLAVEALRLAQDAEQKPAVRFAGMKEFRAALRDLQLPELLPEGQG